jgi:hypothetical protein
VQGEGRGWRVPRSAFAALGYALLIGAWAFTSPIGAAPDEQAHTVRAAAASVGELEGRPVAPYQRGGGLSPVALILFSRVQKSRDSLGMEIQLQNLPEAEVEDQQRWK